MDIQDAINTIKALADGVYPATGELLPEKHVCHEAAVKRALSMAASALGQVGQLGKRRTQLPENAGKPWGLVEDQDLLERFRQGVNIDTLAKTHGRTRGAIASRLVRLGEVEDKAILEG